MATISSKTSSHSIPLSFPSLCTQPPANLPPDPIPPNPDPPPPAPPQPNRPPNPLPEVKWSSLFASKPRNAGIFSPPPIIHKFSGKSVVPTPDIIQASVDIWQDYLMGFSLDSPLPYYAVVNHLKTHWKPRGPVKVKYNGNIFFFLLQDSNDRKRILEADPMIIRNKVFIITKWDVSMGSISKGIKQVPVWIRMYDLPMVAWSQIGICWLASLVGKFLCMDQSTESLERLGYAKCMVEITSSFKMRETLSVLLEDGTEHTVKVTYLWKPDLCSVCKVFGHTLEKCTKLAQADKPVRKEEYSKQNVSANEIRSEPSKQINVNNLAGFNDQPRRIPKKISAKSNKLAKVQVYEKWKRKDGSKFGKQKVIVNKDNPQTNGVSSSNKFAVLGTLNAEKQQVEEGEITDEPLLEIASNADGTAVVPKPTVPPDDPSLVGENKERMVHENLDKIQNRNNDRVMEKQRPLETNNECYDGMNKDDALQTILKDIKEFENSMRLDELDEEDNSDGLPQDILEDAQRFEETMMTGGSQLLSKDNTVQANMSDQVSNFTFKPGFLNIFSPKVKPKQATQGKVIDIAKECEASTSTVTSNDMKRGKPKQAHPYAHILPPAAYKPPPQADTFDQPKSPVAKEVSTPITRSKFRQLNTV